MDRAQKKTDRRWQLSAESGRSLKTGDAEEPSSSKIQPSVDSISRASSK
jgi:hypothetical protein